MTPEELKELTELRKTKEEYISVLPRLEAFQENRLYYATMPFIPQDMGFEHTLLRGKGKPTMDIYHRDGISCTKGTSGRWIFQKGDERMFFDIKNRFEAYIILRSLGIEFEISTEEEEI